MFTLKYAQSIKILAHITFLLLQFRQICYKIYIKGRNGLPDKIFIFLYSENYFKFTGGFIT